MTFGNAATPFPLVIPTAILREMIAQAEAELPNECCGLLAGQIFEGVGRVERAYPLVNEAASPREFLSEPASMFAACRDIDRRGLTILAVYHSHPTSAAVPSRTDRERNYSPHVATVIMSLQGKEPSVRVWWLTESEQTEGAWETC